MLRHFIILPVVLVVVAMAVPETCSAEDPSAGHQVAQSTTVKSQDGGEVTLHYWLYLPKNYGDIQSAPLMLFLHGAGERGDDLSAVKHWGPPKLIEDGQDFESIVVSPQCPENSRWRADELAQLVDFLAGELKVDQQRMYCTGLSMGGFGTWSILAAHAKLFAAGAPICGGGRTDDAEKLKDIPIWAFHGDADPVVPVSRSQAMFDAIKEVGGEKIELTIYPGVSHNSWTETFANPKLYEWLLAQRRAE